MFEVALELAPLKSVDERVVTSFLFIGGICIAVAGFIHWALELIFQTIMFTQGSKLIQNMMLGLYQVRKTKPITRGTQKLQVSHHQTTDNMMGKTNHTHENNNI